MKTRILATAALLFAATAVSHAQNNNYNATQNETPMNGSSWFNSNSDELYRANEWSLEVFAAGASDDNRHVNGFDHFNRHNARAGGGGGLDYFFCRYIGIEADTLALANRHNTASAVGGNLILRWPIGETGFAPYVLGGGGEEFTYKTEGYGDGGLGLEYRFSHRIGLFGDGTFVSPGTTHDFGLARIGVRFTF